MLFDAQHIWFIVLSLLFIVGVEVLLFFFVTTERLKNMFLQLFAVLTVILHFSKLWVNYFATGVAKADLAMLMPYYPCHIVMWLLVILAFIKNKQSLLFALLAEFAFYMGVLGGLSGIFLNFLYEANPTLANWDVLSSLLSHTFLITGSAYLLIGKYIKIRVFNCCSALVGFALMLVTGGVIIGLHQLFHLDPPNSMFLVEPPFSEVPWFNTWLIGALALILLFAFTAIYEQIAVKPEERWYRKLQAYKLARSERLKEWTWRIVLKINKIKGEKSNNGIFQKSGLV